MTSAEPSHYANVKDARNIADAFWKRVAREPDTVIYRYALASSASSARVWREETYREAGVKVARLAHYLKAKGVGAGTTVAILSSTRTEWMLADMAAQTLGAIVVSVYQSLTAAEAGFILYDSKSSFIFIENEEQARKIDWLKKNHCPVPERENIPASSERLNLSTIIAFETISTLSGIDVVREIVENSALPSSPPATPAEIDRSSVASYVYTSGTTGPPKGVIQTHGNHLTNVEQAAISGVFAGDGSLFLYLPLAHSFARLIYYIGYLTSSSLVLPAIIDHHSSKLDLASIARDIREGSATVVPSVPRLFEKMASAIKTRAAGRGLSSKILRICLKNAEKHRAIQSAGKQIGIIDSIIFTALDGIRRKVSAQLFGPNFKHGVSGGARLDPEVNKFCDALGITICEGYGLTETCVATHVNLPERPRIGSVGPAFKWVETFISPEDNEIWLRGPNITQGYLNRPKATAEAWTGDGWFKTGDVGRLDDDGFLYITDRKKELVITAGGKKIPPTELEGVFKRYPFVSHAFLYGDGKPYCVMLFTTNDLELRAQLQAEGIAVTQEDTLSRHPAVLKRFEQAVSEVNESLASYETIKRFIVLDEDFSIENGLLTPTLKMKRKLIVQRYSQVIDSLYD